MTTDTRDHLGDEEIDRRLRATLAAVMPMLDARADPASTADRPMAIDDGPGASKGDGLRLLEIAVPDVAAPMRGHRRRFALVTVAAAAAMIALLVATVPKSSGSGPRLAPSSTESGNVTPTTDSVAVGPPRWYERIRPFVPDGFDQIALTRSSAAGMSFQAVRAATGQVLDVNLSLQDEGKQTTDTVTHTDASGSWIEATSSVTLRTPERHLVTVWCGPSLWGGGGVGSVTMAMSQRDYCGEGFDHAGIDAPARRAMAAAFATQFDPAWLDASFGVPSLVPDPAGIAASISATIPGIEVTSWMTQWEGVVVSTPIGPNDADRRSTQLSAVAGVYPDRQIDRSIGGVAAPDAASLLMVHGDLAAGWIVDGNGTGFQVVTRNLSEANRRRLGALLEHLAGVASSSAATAVEPVLHARTGTFGSGGENGVGEILRLDAVDAPDVVAAIGADVPLPPGGSFALFIAYMHASRNIDTDVGVRGSLEQLAACQWVDYWLDSKTVGDPQAMAAAGDAIAAVPTRPALVAVDGGGVVGPWRLIADAVQRHDLAALDRQLGVCAGAVNRR